MLQLLVISSYQVIKAVSSGPKKFGKKCILLSFGYEDKQNTWILKMMFFWEIEFKLCGDYGNLLDDVLMRRNVKLRTHLNYMFMCKIKSGRSERRKHNTCCRSHNFPVLFRTTF